jgi:sphingomyelin phosphodiesterase
MISWKNILCGSHCNFCFDYEKPSAPKLKVLHLTDLHVDFEYEPKSLADCDQPLCCRRTSTSKNGSLTPDRLAGYWGDYRDCDLPLWTLQNMFQHIASKEDVNFTCSSVNRPFSFTNIKYLV